VFEFVLEELFVVDVVARDEADPVDRKESVRVLVKTPVVAREPY